MPVVSRRGRAGDRRLSGRLRVAITGASGFIGRQLLATLATRSHQLRLLSRRPVELDGQAEIVRGSLDDGSALAALVEGADVVVHIAGIVRSSNRGDFARINAAATERLAGLAAAAGCRRFLLVSSLAARRPEVSRYARSKRQAEELAAKALAGERLVIVRPPAVYGPGDTVTLPIFRQICGGWLFVPDLPNGRFSMIYVDDLARLLDVAIEAGSPPALIEPDDGAGPYGWQDVAEIGGRAAGVRVRRIGLPRRVMAPLAGLCDLAAGIVGRPLMLSRDKLGELFHDDWCAAGTALEGWRPEVPFAEGARRTIDWYRRQYGIEPSGRPG